MAHSNKLTSLPVIAQSGVLFGTSGARGLVTKFKPEVCAAFTVSFLSAMKRDYKFKTLALAIDNRPSSYDMAKACAAAAQQLGIDVIYYGVVPTPALAFIAQEDRMPGIMVTGSHIPFDRNGLKFYRPDGEITKGDEEVIVTGQVEFNSTIKLDELIINEQATEEYITRYTSLFTAPWLTGKRIGIYEHSSAGRELYYRIFEKLGAEVIALERSDEFVPIDTEAVSEEDTLKAISWSKEHNLDIIFSTDGDGDRPLVSDESGNWLRGDILGLLCAKALKIDALAVPVSCNSAIELSQSFDYVKRTKIGSPYVIAEFDTLAKDCHSVAGFEANGGFLLGSDIEINGQLLKALPTRDAVLPALMILSAAGKGNISTLVNSLPKRFTYSDRLQNFAKEKSEKLIEFGIKSPAVLMEKLGFVNVTISHTDITDGLRITLTDGDIIHLRPSGNAPELRCYAEANDYSKAQERVIVTLNHIKNLN
jgi:phosphomannomutase